MVTRRIPFGCTRAAARPFRLTRLRQSKTVRDKPKNALATLPGLRLDGRVCADDAQTKETCVEAAKMEWVMGLRVHSVNRRVAPPDIAELLASLVAARY